LEVKPLGPVHEYPVPPVAERKRYSPVHTGLGVAVIVAVDEGFTITVAVTGVPLHPLAAGVTVNVTVIGALVVLISVPEIFPEPEAGIPVTVPALFLVQLNTVPATEPVSTIGVIALCEHIDWLFGAAKAVGVGLTKTVDVIEGPLHPLIVALDVNVTVIGPFVILVKVPVMLPLPEAGIPVTVPVLSRDHVNVEPATLLPNWIVVILLPEQIVWDNGVLLIEGVGVTVTVAVKKAPGQV
jgi:hypothetical protein